MSAHLWVLSVALGVTALLTWGAVVRGERVVERITRPTFMLLLIGLAWSLRGESEQPQPRSLTVVVAALLLGLVGDVFLLHQTQARFLAGLLCFLGAQVAWIWAILETPGRDGFPWWALPLVPLLLAVHARFGRDAVRHAGRQRLPVLIYELGLFALVLVAGWKGDWVVVLGALVFVASDAILAHDRFVLERRRAPLQAVATYQVAHVLLVVGLMS